MVCPRKKSLAYAETVVPVSILNFWFSAPANRLWFEAVAAFDEEIRVRYESVWELACSGQLDHWRKTAAETLALIIVLDQFPLNMFRGTAKSFATEKKAVETSHYAISRKFDLEVTIVQLPFLYMPLMHSEILADQDLSVAMFEKPGLESSLRYAQHHRNIIQKFGRFPHRNVVLNRVSSKEELEYLSSPDAFKG